ncbi:MAG TPA: sulfur oxidation c-type cytochrome SoxX [Gammaproteobacteria bacterium]|nr:sulfur oxidation c-type cytochrome SoxX [Gammaproteobacteria bacterium]
MLTLIPALASAEGAASTDEGKKLAFDRKKGNCLACHMIEGGDLPGNIGPPLIAMKARYPDKAKLRAQIADARTANPNTIMIPFGPHGVLTDEEIDKVTDFIYSK